MTEVDYCAAIIAVMELKVLECVVCFVCGQKFTLLLQVTVVSAPVESGGLAWRSDVLGAVAESTFTIEFAPSENPDFLVAQSWYEDQLLRVGF